MLAASLSSRHYRTMPCNSSLGRRDRFLDIVHRMTGKVLGDLAAKNFRQLFVVALAKLAEGARSGDDDEIGNFALQHPLVEQPGDSTGEAVFRGLALVGIGRTALMACARSGVYVFDIPSGIAVSAGLASSPVLLNKLNFSPSATATIVPLGTNMKSPEHEEVRLKNRSCVNR